MTYISFFRKNIRNTSHFANFVSSFLLIALLVQKSAGKDEEPDEGEVSSSDNDKIDPPTVYYIHSDVHFTSSKMVRDYHEFHQEF